MNATAIRVSLLCYGILFIGIILIADKGGGAMWHFVTDVPLGDKLGHFSLVGTLSLLLNLALKGRPAPGPLAGIMLGSLLVGLGMSLEECSQAYFPSRTFDLIDGLANLAGTAGGEIAARFLLRSQRACPAPG